MRTLGIVFVVLGVLALVYGGITYSRDRTVLQMGSMEITSSEQRSIPIPAVAGVVVLIGGLALLVMNNRRSLRT
jgi:uncharacterized membrane protein YidH (DUF202 family)